MARSGLFLLALCAVFIGGGAAFSADSSLPTADPPGTWRRITRESGSTDSRCIGQLTAPLCALETWIACFTRRDQSLCALADLYYVDTHNTFESALDQVTRYRVVSSRLLREKDIPKWYRHACTGVWQPGDMEIDTDELECWRDKRGEHCPTGAAAKPNRFRNIVRRGDDGLWHFIGREGRGGWHWLYNGTCYE